MELEQENLLNPFISLDNLLRLSVLQDTKADFLTFVRLMAPTLVSDWKMGKHIEVISNKLSQ